MPDEHPCFDRDGYGLSKYLMEEATRYLVRQNDDLDIVNNRLASIVPEGSKPTPCQVGPLTAWVLGSLAKMYQKMLFAAFGWPLKHRIPSMMGSIVAFECVEESLRSTG